MNRIERLSWLVLAVLFLTGCVTEPDPGRCYRVGEYKGQPVWECVGEEATQACIADANACAEYEP